MGCVTALGLTGVVVAIGVGMSAVTGVIMALVTAMVTSIIGFIAFLLILI